MKFSFLLGMGKFSLLKKACIVFVICATTAIASPAQDFTTLYSFCSHTNCTGGSYPYAGLIQATDGNFYGTTLAGANINPDCVQGCGTVFKVTPAGVLTMLYSFCSQTNCTDGAAPYAGLIQATDGNFYGTTSGGGANFTGCQSAGCGTVFKITPSGALTTLYSFCSQTNCTDGADPYAGLIQATDGNFYGTTWKGGANNKGTVFEITPTGVLTPLYSFCSQKYCTDGSYPQAGLIQATDGNFYGTTSYGEANGGGTVFEIIAGDTLYTLTDLDGTDGYPYAGLIQATDGNFYGTTSYGTEPTGGARFSPSAFRWARSRRPS
jgi:uncharacterized repeat protein (TIGR03803 family)